MKLSENDTIIKDIQDLLLYNSKNQPKRLKTAYKFHNDKLYECFNSYICSSTNEYILKYDSLKSELCMFYGKPHSYFESWAEGMKDIYDAKEKPTGYLVSQGILSTMTEWIYGSSEITLLFFKKDNILNLGIMYKHLEKKQIPHKKQKTNK